MVKIKHKRLRPIWKVFGLIMCLVLFSVLSVHIINGRYNKIIKTEKRLQALEYSMALSKDYEDILIRDIAFKIKPYSESDYEILYDIPNSNESIMVENTIYKMTENYPEIRNDVEFIKLFNTLSKTTYNAYNYQNQYSEIYGNYYDYVNTPVAKIALYKYRHNISTYPYYEFKGVTYGNNI